LNKVTYTIENGLILLDVFVALLPVVQMNEHVCKVVLKLNSFLLLNFPELLLIDSVQLLLGIHQSGRSYHVVWIGRALLIGALSSITLWVLSHSSSLSCVCNCICHHLRLHPSSVMTMLMTLLLLALLLLMRRMACCRACWALHVCLNLQIVSLNLFPILIYHLILILFLIDWFLKIIFFLFLLFFFFVTLISFFLILINLLLVLFIPFTFLVLMICLALLLGLVLPLSCNWRVRTLCALVWFYLLLLLLLLGCLSSWTSCSLLLAIMDGFSIFNAKRRCNTNYFCIFLVDHSTLSFFLSLSSGSVTKACWLIRNLLRHLIILISD